MCTKLAIRGLVNVAVLVLIAACSDSSDVVENDEALGPLPDEVAQARRVGGNNEPSNHLDVDHLLGDNALSVQKLVLSVVSEQGRIPREILDDLYLLKDKDGFASLFDHFFTE